MLGPVGRSHPEDLLPEPLRGVPRPSEWTCGGGGGGGGQVPAALRPVPAQPPLGHRGRSILPSQGLGFLLASPDKNVFMTCSWSFRYSCPPTRSGLSGKAETAFKNPAVSAGLLTLASLAANRACGCRFINLGFDRFHTDRPGSEPVRMEVFTSRIGNAPARCRPQTPRLGLILHICVGFVFFASFFGETESKSSSSKPGFTDE